MADPNTLTFDDYMKVIEANRTRVRALGTIIATVCSFTLTASTAFLAYIYKGETGNQVDKNIRYPISAAVVCATIALALVVWAFVLRKPATAFNRVAALATLGGIYQEEQTRIRRATLGLAMAIVLFLIGVGWFVWTVEPKIIPAPTPVSAPAAGTPTTSST